MASDHGVPKPRTEDHPNRKVGREAFETEHVPERMRMQEEKFRQARVRAAEGPQPKAVWEEY